MYLAVLYSIATVAAAPFLGRLRDLLLERFPADSATPGPVVLGLLVGVALVLVVARIRDRYGLRYGSLALALVLVWIQLRGSATVDSEVDVVERVHLLQYGLLSVLFQRAFRPSGSSAAIVLTVLSGMLVGILDEWLQWFVASRVGEAPDLGLNAVAIGTGLLFALALNPAADGRSRTWRPTVAVMTAVVILAFGGFYHCAHLGYEIHDEEGELIFLSSFSRRELPGVAANRAERWRAGQLPSLDPLSREDYFFLEGTLRVAHRNASLERGDVFEAWGEQRILERYYAPVLGQRGLRSGRPLDLETQERRDLRRRAERVPQTIYSSPVLENRIAVTPSKPVWWIMIGALTIASAAVALWLVRR